MPVTFTVSELIAIIAGLIAIGGWIGLVKYTSKEIQEFKKEANENFKEIKTTLTQIVNLVTRHDVRLGHLEEENDEGNGRRPNGQSK